MMMLAPIGYAVIEFCRVPLAMSVRAHRSWLIKTLALVGVICRRRGHRQIDVAIGRDHVPSPLVDVVHAAEECNMSRHPGQLTQQIADADHMVRSVAGMDWPKWSNGPKAMPNNWPTFPKPPPCVR